MKQNNFTDKEYTTKKNLSAKILYKECNIVFVEKNMIINIID